MVGLLAIFVPDVLTFVWAELASSYHDIVSQWNPWWCGSHSCKSWTFGTLLLVIVVSVLLVGMQMLHYPCYANWLSCFRQTDETQCKISNFECLCSLRRRFSLVVVHLLCAMVQIFGLLAVVTSCDGGLSPICNLCMCARGPVCVCVNKSICPQINVSMVAALTWGPEKHHRNNHLCPPSSPRLYLLCPHKNVSLFTHLKK